MANGFGSFVGGFGQGASNGLALGLKMKALEDQKDKAEGSALVNALKTTFEAPPAMRGHLLKMLAPRMGVPKEDVNNFVAALASAEQETLKSIASGMGDLSASQIRMIAGNPVKMLPELAAAFRAGNKELREREELGNIGQTLRGSQPGPSLGTLAPMPGQPAMSPEGLSNRVEQFQGPEIASPQERFAQARQMALSQGRTELANAMAPKTETINLAGPDGRNVTMMRNDPRLSQMLDRGFTEVKTPAVQLNIGDDAFVKKIGENLAKSIGDLTAGGQAAIGTEDSLRQMADLMAQGLQTGRLQPAVTALQGIAADLGFNLAEMAKKQGIDLSKLEDKESFDRLATTVIVDGFAKFKGNLNQKEVELAENAFSNLGRSEWANIDAIAAGLAAQAIARERASKAMSVGTREQAVALQQDLLRGGSKQFLEMKNTFKLEIAKSFRERRGEADMPRVTTDEEREKLPKGTRYIDSQGNVRVRR